MWQMLNILGGPPTLYFLVTLSVWSSNYAANWCYGREKSVWLPGDWWRFWWHCQCTSCGRVRITSGTHREGPLGWHLCKTNITALFYHHNMLRWLWLLVGKLPPNSKWDTCSFRSAIENKMLSCRRETARRFLSLNILLSHSRSFEMTLLRKACVSSY